MAHQWRAVESGQGPKGGYGISIPLDRITLADIYEAVHGEIDPSMPG